MTVTLPLRFNAGKVDYDEDKQVYTPLPTPGEIIIDHSPEGEGCYSFVWRPRGQSTGQPESAFELFVFQSDVVWKRINSCTTGRVYMLGFYSSGAKHRFWMQDLNDEGAIENDDEEALKAASAKDIEIEKQIQEVFSDE